MSTPSKKRRKAREWMQKRIEENAQKLETIKQHHVRALEEERARWTSMLAPTENVCHPLGRPEQTVYMVPALQGFSPPRVLNPRDLRYYEASKIYRFKVKQFAQVMPCGLRVVWYGLEQIG